MPPPLHAPRPIAVAHRGAHGPRREENSVAATREAVRLGAPGIEVDAHRLGDGTLVAWHDDDVEIAGERRPLATLRGGEVPLPAISDLLDALHDHPGLLVFDWKGYGEEARLASLLRDSGLFERTLLTSVYPSVLASLRTALPDLALGLSVPASAYAALPDLAATIELLLRESGAGTAGLDRRLPGLPELVAGVRRLRCGVFLWTAPDVATFADLARFEPDGIMTDRIETQLAAGAPAG